jgi:hypothetical protein
MEVLGYTLLILGLIALGMLSKHLRGRKQIQIRQIIHNERMRAMEKGIPFSDLDHESMARELAQMNEESGNMESNTNRSVVWIRLYALCLGVLLLFGGIGIAAGFPLVGNEEFRTFWAIGFIPALMGLGLLIFYGLSRGYEKKLS